ncbi:MAG: carbohydrate kinase family protein [Candidatus Poribacteria bacterium]
MDRLDFVGFGALNLDIFYSLKYGKNTENILPELHPGGEIIGLEKDRIVILENSKKYAVITGKSGGGQSANTAVALAKMGFKCGFIGKVGDDDFGEFLLKSLENVDQSHIKKGEKSGVCLCILDQNGERANVIFPGSNDTLSIDNSDIEYAKNSKVIYLTSFCSEKVLREQEKLLDSDLNKSIIAFDPGEIYSRLGIDRLKKILERTKILFATDSELELMTNETYQKSVKQIMDLGTEIVVCKMGERGSIIFTNESEFPVPITRVKNVIDKTGAGDVYSAGFIAGMLMKLPLEYCGKLASSASALSITGYGREKYPDIKFLKNFLKDNIVVSSC